MKAQQVTWSSTSGWDAEPTVLRPGLVLAFGSMDAASARAALAAVAERYPCEHTVGCSTAGEISDIHVSDGTLTVLAMEFEATGVRVACSPVGDGTSAAAGRHLAEQLLALDLVHVLVFSDGLHANGSELVEGMNTVLPANVSITGGLAGDGDRFETTWVAVGGQVESGLVAAVGLYGSQLRVGYGSLGGWDSFGPERPITRSTGNVLYELDGKPALDLYKAYLGPHAAGLPASGLLFPLAVRASEDDAAVVRTILAVDESQGSITFAGDVPTGMWARLMKANFDRLIDGAAGAANTSISNLECPPAAALLISCVGRKLVLGQRIEEEVEAVREVLGPVPRLAGFYSYGELSPFTLSGRCELHNQTMTVTTFGEVGTGA